MLRIPTILLSMIIVLGCKFFIKDAEVNIIPKPVELEIMKGHFNISELTGIWIVNSNKDFSHIREILAERLRKLMGKELPIHEVREYNISKGILLVINEIPETFLGNEGYHLLIESDKIIIRANEAAGVFYGVQSLFQLLPCRYGTLQELKTNEEIVIPCVRITDKPRFQYRGMHLDVCRHFFPVSFIKRYIDLLAMHKMNVFHWHLTEDQGWRIEIKAYPELTSVGAWRKEKDGSQYGGYYTLEEITAIIKYARDRFITIIPEIEMPGHSLASLASYPELSCTGGPFEVANTWGVFEDVYCAGNEKTFEFLENVLTEIAALFPSAYIHIGGDECPKTRWENCSKCSQRMKTEGLNDPHELQSYFIKRIAAILEKKNKKLIGWDEILEGGLAEGATVMSWRGMEGGITAAEKGHDVIMSPTEYCYFDFYQAERSTQPKAIGGFTPLEKVYSFEPVPDKISSENKAHIIGGQANVWTEYIFDSRQVEYMSVPRMTALSEVLWSPRESRNWDDFRARLQTFKRQFDIMKVNYFDNY